MSLETSARHGHVDANSGTHGFGPLPRARMSEILTPKPAPARTRFSSISIVFPAYNEEDNIEIAVAQARTVAARHFRDYEVIVVNDGSSDRTSEIIHRLAELHPEVVAIDHDTNRGYGAALSSGIYRATKELIFFADSDLQFDLEDIAKLLVWIDGHDIVAGYRARRADNLMRRFNAYAWNRLVRLVLGVDLRDIDCAFKIFRREVFETIRIESVGAMVNTEIFALAKPLGMSIKEVPVRHFPRRAGEQSGANLRVIFKAFRELGRMHRRIHRELTAPTAPAPASTHGAAALGVATEPVRVRE